MRLRARKLLPFFHFPFSIFLLALSQGCASGPATLTLRPVDQKVAFAKTFSQAYCGKESDGTYACVLVSDDASTSGEKQTLRPQETAPLRQVVHIKVLWRPLSGTRESAAANAAIDWYVMSRTPQGSDDLLLYQGAGFVTLEPDGDTAKVTIRSADLRPAMAHGNLKDPIGNASVTGAFVAAADNKRMNELLSTTRQRLATVASGE